MKNITIVTLLFLPFIILGQADTSAGSGFSTKKNDTAKVSRIEIGVSFSPDYSYRILQSDAASEEIKQTRDTMEVARFSYTTGINIGFHIGKKITVETGVLFSDKGEKTKKISFANVPSGQLPVYFTYKYHYLYLDIPVKANYYFYDGKVKLYVTAGLSANFFLTQKTTIVQGHTNVDSEKTISTVDPGFNPINFAVLAGAGLNYKMNDKFNLKVEPVYRRSLTSVINAPVKSYLYSAGLNIGISYKL